MGLFKKIFGNRIREQTLELLQASINQLKTGIFSRLIKKYELKYGNEKANLLSVAILNRVLLEEPSNVVGKSFYQNNSELVENELLTLSSEVSIEKALSYLYAAQTLNLVYITKDPFSKQSQELGEQANHLNIYIPNTYDICGSDNVHECALEIMEYATTFYKTSLE